MRLSLYTIHVYTAVSSPVDLALPDTEQHNNNGNHATQRLLSTRAHAWSHIRKQFLKTPTFYTSKTNSVMICDWLH